jgi:cytochrome c-type biogenesis protein CcmE
MKRSNIIILILIAISIGVIISMVGDFSTYETFASAASQPDKEFHVISVLDKARATQYDPVKDPNYFSFYARDKAGVTKKVVFAGSMPTDFNKSEQIVLIGRMNGTQFYCSKILMKCPSKYKADREAQSRKLDTRL